MQIYVRREFDGTPKFKNRELGDKVYTDQVLNLASAIVEHTNRLGNPCNSEQDYYTCRWCGCAWEWIKDRRCAKGRRRGYLHRENCSAPIAIRLLKNRKAGEAEGE